MEQDIDQAVESLEKLQVRTDHKPEDLPSDEEDPSDSLTAQFINEHLNSINKNFEIKQRKTEELEFPDEKDTPTHIDARVRFQKFRGLANFKTSEWDPYENLPESYSKIYEIQNINTTYKKLAIENDMKQSQTLAGLYVRLLIEVPQNAVQKINPQYPLIISSLLEHERKLSIIHFKITRCDDKFAPLGEVKSKQLLEFNFGFRRVLTKPLFSEFNIKNEKLKYENNILPNKQVVASIYAPVFYGPAPCLVFQHSEQGVHLLAQGQFYKVDPKQLIIKRIILTGYPVKVQKRKAVCRYMFFNPRDIEFFKPIELNTKLGLRGHIRESVGTHGLMKCIFNNFIKHDDTVCLKLYKRVFPVWFPGTWES